VYARRRGSDRPERLVAFGRVEVDTGATGSLDLAIALSSLAVRDVQAHSMVVLPGRYGLRVARHATDPGMVLEVAVGLADLGGPHPESGADVDDPGTNTAT
jgi:hypothetical protein